MLSLIHIENMAVIEKCEIEFFNGLNVLTGETGAGKSIIIDSISALLGNRTSKDIVRHGNKKGSVLGIFTDISFEIIEKLLEFGIETENDTVHISREISSEGKNVCRVNSKPVSASILKELAPYLINIHGQHDGQKLMSDTYHVNFLDSFGNNIELINEYKEQYTRYYGIKKELTALKEQNTKIDDRIEYLKFMVIEIEKAELNPLEEDALKSRKELYLNHEKTIKSLSLALKLLKDSEENIFDMVSTASNSLGEISELSEDFGKIFEKCEDIKYEVGEISTEIEKNLTSFDFDDNEIEIIEQRLDEIYSLKRKYGNTVEILLENYETSKKELETLSNIDESIEDLEETFKENRAKLIDIGKKLSFKRQSDGEKLTKAIISELETLDMASTLFAVEIQNSGKLGANGIDLVSFLIATNKGDKLKPLSKIASGGELSRIMLAIKNILSKTEDVGTLIFDEVDTGVSGKAGGKIANKLYDVSNNKQVLCVTHLASIASMADHHYSINKSHTEEKTFTMIEKLNTEDRKKEIARIIGGDVLTDTSVKNAEELIDNANKYKL